MLETRLDPGDQTILRGLYAKMEQPSKKRPERKIFQTS